MIEATTTTYALLGLLAVQPWTGYELTKQARRSLHYVWPSSEANLYREQQRLVRLGWATAEKEPVGERTRNRYRITEEGREALAGWLETEPEPPRIEIEGVLRLFFADHGKSRSLDASLRSTAAEARDARDALLENLGEYVTGTGPFPARAYPIALVCEVIIELLDVIDRFGERTATELTNARTLTSKARQAEGLERIQALVARVTPR